MRATFLSRWSFLLAILFVFVLSAMLPAFSAPTKFMINGYVQGRYTQSLGEEKTSTVPTEAFDIKRAYIFMHASVDEHVGAAIMVSGAPKVAIYEAYAEYVDNPFQGRLGLSRIPFGYEVPLSSAKLITLERSMAEQTLVYPFAFDRGAFLYYLPTKILNVSAAVTNGRPPDLSAATPPLPAEVDTKKNAIGRIGFFIPYIPQGQIGLSTYIGHNPSTEANMNLYNLDLQATAGPITVISEWIQGTMGTTKPEGGYVTLAFQMPNSASQPYARFDIFDPDKNTTGDFSRRYTAGYSYYLAPGSKATLEYEAIHDPAQPQLKGRLTGQYQVVF